MRLIQLDLDSDGVLDLHPNVSIVSGLGDEHRALLVDAVLGLARFEALPTAGLLEAHGVLFDLDQKLLSVIAENTEGIDPIIRPSQLPAQPTTVEARQLRLREHDLALLRETAETQVRAHEEALEALAAATEELEQARCALDEGTTLERSSRQDLQQLTQRCAELEAERSRLVDELEAARSQRDAAEVALATIARDAAAALVGVEEAEALRSSVEAELVEVGALDSGQVQTEVDQARTALQEIEAEIQAEIDAERAAEAERAALGTGGVVGASAVSAVDRLERLDARIAELERLLSVITPVERVEVERARARLAGRGSGGMVASPEAERLADEIDRVAAEIAALGSDGTTMSGGDLARSRTRLDDAHQALLEAERAARTPTLDKEAVARLEEVHDLLVEATDAPRSRFGGSKRPVVPIDELRVEEQELLDQLGFASYPAYVMGYSLHETDPQLEAAVEQARIQLADAEAAWAEAERLTDVVLARAALLDERRVLLEQAQRLLGRVTTDATPQEALRSLRVPGGSVAAAATALSVALEAVGVVVGDEDVDHEELLELAEAWLSESERVDTRRHDATTELESLQAQRTELAAEAEAEITAGDVPGPDGVAVSGVAVSGDDAEELRFERIGRARGVLAAAEQRLADAGAITQKRDSLVADLAAARELEHGARESLANAEAARSTAEAEQEDLIDRVAARHEELDRIDRELAETRARIEELAVSVPDPGLLQERVAIAERVHASALPAAEEAHRALEDVRSQMVVVEGGVETLRDIVGSTTASEATPAEELEWYLLARLAAQRSVSVAGSVPVLLDDALRGLAAEDVPIILDRLERMAEAVQVIILSEDPIVAAWATGAGIERAAVVGVTAA